MLFTHHSRYRERGPMKSWRPETMAEAIWSVLQEGLSLSQAARKHDIPYPTFVLYANRVHNMLGPSISDGTPTVGGKWVIEDAWPWKEEILFHVTLLSFDFFASILQRAMIYAVANLHTSVDTCTLIEQTESAASLCLGTWGNEKINLPRIWKQLIPLKLGFLMAYSWLVRAQTQRKRTTSTHPAWKLARGTRATSHSCRGLQRWHHPSVPDSYHFRCQCTLHQRQSYAFTSHHQEISNA